MANATLKKATLKDPRGKLTADLRRWLASRDRAKKVVEGLTTLIYKSCYEWVAYTETTGQAKNREDAIKRLANTVRKTPGAVYQWFYFGKFMREHRLDAKKVQATAIVLAWNNWSAISEREQELMSRSLKTVGTRAGVSSILLRSKMYREREALRKIQHLEQKGLFNKTHMKMEAMALQTFATHFFGRDVRIGIFANGDTLMELK